MERKDIDNRISVLLLTRNEQENLPRCLRALHWCDDVVVLDSFSTDSTEVIAESYGARVYKREFDSFAGQRNYGLEKIDFRHEWILHLDADEVVPPELVEALHDVSRRHDKDAYRIPSKTIFEDRWIRWAGMYPTYQVRLSRRPNFRFVQDGHGQKEGIPSDRIGNLAIPYAHHAFSRGLFEWFEKHNRYSSQEASATVTGERQGRRGIRNCIDSDAYVRRQALRNLSRGLPFRPLLRFLYMYLLRLGFLDGRPGLDYCLLMSCYEFMTSIKIRESRRLLERSSSSERRDGGK